MAARQNNRRKKRGEYKTHSTSVRAEIVEAALEGKGLAEGETWRDRARQLGVNVSTARAWVKSGRVAPLPKGGRLADPKRKLSDTHGDFIYTLLQERPTTPLTTVKKLLKERFGIEIDPTNISRYVKRQDRFTEILKVRQLRPKRQAAIESQPVEPPPPALRYTSGTRLTDELLRSGPIQSFGRFDQLPMISRRPTSSTEQYIMPRFRKSSRLLK
ncbi:hypothetical protein FOL47_011366 [Perkinsus chesapeaki]|uniref:Uncharacterized protein n=1 Tax=Perkinsus chesapeaki TaxID=330153 RepID=A0A7J6MMG5_PERCH|nr:hypothetical protein FOL47_011366 [Perkinsus chesapeaki]